MSKLEIADTTAQQTHALEILNALHREGFTTCWLDSVLVFSGGLADRTPQIKHHLLRVIIGAAEIHGSEFQKVLMVAARHNSRVQLAEVRLNGQNFSRLAIWPDVKEGEA